MTETPLIVDLDGTLLKTDTLHEGLMVLLACRPWRIPGLAGAFLAGGRPAVKRRIAGDAPLDVETLPMREDLVAWLADQRARGREIHLVSAADQSVVDQVARRAGLFATATGSDGRLNLKGRNKADYLNRQFPDGFAYAGDSAADLAVWPHAASIVVAGGGPSLARRAGALGKPVEAVFPRTAGIRQHLRQLRLHQWSKNLLVFVPLLLAHRFHETGALLSTLGAFFGLSIAASATYVLNDLLDLAADRRHHSKRFRPLAAGDVSIAWAMTAVPVLLLLGLGLMAAVSLLTLVSGLVYLALTLSYSWYLKRVPLLDTGALGLLFTLRLLVGCAAAHLPPSPWMLAFSITLFFSLSMAKRQTEIMKKIIEGTGQSVAGRGYRTDDAALTLAYGVSTGVASLVILMLYTTNDIARNLYREPNWLWAIPLLLLFWQMRVWLLAHRGELNDDPIVFALKDRISLLIGAACAIAFYFAL